MIFGNAQIKANWDSESLWVKVWSRPATLENNDELPSGSHWIKYDYIMIAIRLICYNSSEWYMTPFDYSNCQVLINGAGFPVLNQSS